MEAIIHPRPRPGNAVFVDHVAMLPKRVAGGDQEGEAGASSGSLDDRGKLVQLHPIVDNIVSAGRVNMDFVNAWLAAD